MKQPGKNIKWPSKDYGLVKTGGLRNQKKKKKKKLNKKSISICLLLRLDLVCLFG